MKATMQSLQFVIALSTVDPCLLAIFADAPIATFVIVGCHGTNFLPPTEKFLANVTLNVVILDYEFIATKAKLSSKFFLHTHLALDPFLLLRHLTVALVVVLRQLLAVVLVLRGGALGSNPSASAARMAAATAAASASASSCWILNAVRRSVWHSSFPPWSLQ
jgi:hypothetical protein